MHKKGVRFTADIDFFYKPDEENCIRLYDAFQEFWGGTVPVVKSYHELTKKGQILQFGQPPNRLDFINDIEGVLFEECTNTMCIEMIQCKKWYFCSKAGLRFIRRLDLSNPAVCGSDRNTISKRYAVA